MPSSLRPAVAASKERHQTALEWTLREFMQRGMERETMRTGSMVTAPTAALMSGLVALPSFDVAAAEEQSVAQAVDAVGLGLAVEAGTRASRAHPP